jgi:hypothetical protein
MATHYGNIKATFYRDFVSQQSLNPSNGGIGGPVFFSRSNAGTYVGSDGYIKTAGANIPRFNYEYDNSGVLQYRGLYIDPNTSNNNFIYSEDFTQAVWTKTNTQIESTSTLSPNGTDNGSRLELTSSGGSMSYNLSLIGATNANKRFMYISLMAKASECNHLRIHISNGTYTTECYYNLSNGTVGTNTAGTANQLLFVHKYVCNMGNGWYRLMLCVQDVQLASPGINYTISFSPTTSASSLTGSNGDGCLIFGTMLNTIFNQANGYEVAFAQYIKTTGSVVDVGADTCNLSTKSLWLESYPASEFTGLCQFYSPYNFCDVITGGALGFNFYTSGNAFDGGFSIRHLRNNANLVVDKYTPSYTRYDYANFITRLGENRVAMTHSNSIWYTFRNGVNVGSRSSIGYHEVRMMSLGGPNNYKYVYVIPIAANTTQLARISAL